MPHIIIKLAEGRSEEAKQLLTPKILEAVTATVNPDQNAVSIAIDELPQSEWKETVYLSEIMKDEKRLYKKPGYSL